MVRKIVKNKSFLTVINFLVASGTIIYLIYTFRKQAAELTALPRVEHWILGVLALLLMPLNLALEAQKWRIAVAGERKVSFSMALYYVISSLPYGIITPSRVGEWYGRSRDFDRPGRGFVLSAIPGIAQQITTIMAGIIGLLILKQWSWRVWLLSGLTFLLLFSVVIFFLRKRQLWQGRDKIDWIVFGNIFILSVLRYVVFSTQYVLLIRFLGVDLELSILYSSIAVGYLVSYLLPLNSFVELGVRSGTLVFILEDMTTKVSALLWATLLVWLVNIALPSLVGSLYLVRNSIR